MRAYLITICLSFLGSSVLKAQSPNTGPGLDTLNATFVPANMLLKHDIAIVNGTEFIDILNVNTPTEVVIYDINGKEVYKNKIVHKTRIEKDQFEKGFYIVRTRSIERETIKKLYL